ncbi:MAG: NAD(P)-dependent oxidoreductase [Usitatibacteraceae bacterium]
MRILVTGSTGHLGEALVRTLKGAGHDVIGIDLTPSVWTTASGSITDRAFVSRWMQGVGAVFHTATLHKPHVVTHNKQAFVDTNISGTLNLLEEAASVGVGVFVFTSTTSVFGDALSPATGAPAVWVTEALSPIPKNIYGATKAAAEDLCRLFSRKHRLPCVVLRTSRFFPEADDSREVRMTYADANIKANEFLYRRVDIADVVSAHLCAFERAADIGFGRYIISATTPFTLDDIFELRRDAPEVVRKRAPECVAEYAARGWKMFPSIDRVYDNTRAREELAWQPCYDFAHVIASLRAGADPRSQLARDIGSKDYHATSFSDGPYPVHPETAVR